MRQFTKVIFPFLVLGLTASETKSGSISQNQDNSSNQEVSIDVERLQKMRNMKLQYKQPVKEGIKANRAPKPNFDELNQNKRLTSKNIMERNRAAVNQEKDIDRTVTSQSQSTPKDKQFIKDRIELEQSKIDDWVKKSE